jgi:uncharacterized membrane protein required for colicin V production
MTTQDSNTATSVGAIAAITIIIVVGCLVGINDTLVKLGIAVIAGIAGFSFSGLIRKQ